MSPTMLVIAAACLLSEGRGPSAPAADPTPLATLSLQLNELPTEPQVFGLNMQARSTADHGTLTFRSSVTMRTTREADQVLLEDTWTISGRTFELRMWCRPDALLSLQRCEVTMKRGEQQRTTQLTIEGQTATAEGPRGAQQMDFPAGTVTGTALFRIVPLLPREAGSAWSFTACTEALELQPRSPQGGGPCRIECKGPATIEIGDTSVACTRYTVVSDSVLDLYVDQGGSIRQMVADEGQTVLVRRADDTAVVVETAR